HSLYILGKIRPTARSITYTFKLKYSFGKIPLVNIVSLGLKRNFKNEKIPHVFTKNELCLYHPNFNEFDSSMLISHTIIPWITLWLYHYENWHITGKWEGGGLHPETK